LAVVHEPVERVFEPGIDRDALASAARDATRHVLTTGPRGRRAARGRAAARRSLEEGLVDAGSRLGLRLVGVGRIVGSGELRPAVRLAVHLVGVGRIVGGGELRLAGDGVDRERVPAALDVSLGAGDDPAGR
jgi:hypothetical protein